MIKISKRSKTRRMITMWTFCGRDHIVVTSRPKSNSFVSKFYHEGRVADEFRVTGDIFEIIGVAIRELKQGRRR